MPFKDPEKKKEYMREYMKHYRTKNAIINGDIYDNLRFLSWMAQVLNIEKYWILSKKELKSKILKKVMEL